MLGIEVIRGVKVCGATNIFLNQTEIKSLLHLHLLHPYFHSLNTNCYFVWLSLLKKTFLEIFLAYYSTLWENKFQFFLISVMHEHISKTFAIKLLYKKIDIKLIRESWHQIVLIFTCVHGSNWRAVTLTFNTWMVVLFDFLGVVVCLRGAMGEAVRRIIRGELEGDRWGLWLGLVVARLTPPGTDHKPMLT